MNYSLTITQLKTAKASADGKPFKLRDGGGLFVFVSATGAKSWRYKYRISGKESVYTMGTFPDLGIADARVMHAKARELVNQGVHPKAQRDADRHITMLIAGDTFKAVADHWFEERKPKWTAYYASQIETSMKADVYPVIGGLPIRKVTSAQILQILKAVDKRGAPVVAMNIRQWCSQVFKYAIVNLKADSDPTAVLQGVVVRPKIKHNVPLTPDQITGLLKEMAKFGGYRTTAIAIELLLLTFVRTAEIRKARWEEFDFEKGEWHIPAGRMKMRVEHFVPLSKQVLALLAELRKITGANEHLFPNLRRPNDYMTPTTINQALKRVGFSGKGTIGFAAHGFRGTAATLLAEQGEYRESVIDRQLAHAERNKVKGAYFHGQYTDERRLMMQSWSDYIDTLRP
jgi:integrase